MFYLNLSLLFSCFVRLVCSRYARSDRYFRSGQKSNGKCPSGKWAHIERWKVVVYSGCKPHPALKFGLEVRRGEIARENLRLRLAYVVPVRRLPIWRSRMERSSPPPPPFPSRWRTCACRPTWIVSILDARPRTIVPHVTIQRRQPRTRVLIFFLHFLSRRASVSRANTFELRWTKWPHISKIFLQTDLLMNFFARVLDLETKWEDKNDWMLDDKSG